MPQALVVEVGQHGFHLSVHWYDVVGGTHSKVHVVIGHILNSGLCEQGDELVRGQKLALRGCTNAWPSVEPHTTATMRTTCHHTNRFELARSKHTLNHAGQRRRADGRGNL